MAYNSGKKKKCKPTYYNSWGAHFVPQIRFGTSNEKDAELQRPNGFFAIAHKLRRDFNDVHLRGPISPNATLCQEIRP